MKKMSICAETQRPVSGEEAAYYDKDFKKHAHMFELLKDSYVENRHRWIFRAINKNDSVLDCGCWCGIFLYQLRKHKSIVATGFDISKCAVEFCNERLDNNVSVGNILDIDAKDGEFDVVVASQVLEHLEQPYLALAEMLRVAKKKVLFTVPIERNLWCPGHLHFFTLTELMSNIKELVGHENFKIDSLSKIEMVGDHNCFAVEINKEE
jgi:ubiquinone/menaquinone biosynthesis C-methylase UbiE